MITEFTIATGIVYGIKYFKNDKIKIKKNFNKIMLNNNLDYKIIKIINEEYGYNVLVNLGLQGYVKLEKTKDMIETALGYHAYIEQNNNLKTATINLVKSITNIKFSPIKTAPYELYISKSFTNHNIISNMTKFPHVLVSGQTGSGKTEQIRIMLTNLIYNYTNRDVNLYFSDLSDTNDFSIFKHCNHTKAYVKNITDSLKLFSYLKHLYTKRLLIFSKYNCKNISEYNRINYSKRMAYIYVILDEFADYFPANREVDNYIEKQKCYNLLKELVRKVRKIGMFLIIGIQRPDTTVLDPSLRSGLCTKIAFSQNSNASSLTVCDTNELTNIENRQALFMAGNKREWFKSLDISDKLISQYICNSFIIKTQDKEHTDSKKQDYIDIRKYTKIRKVSNGKKSKRRVKL